MFADVADFVAHGHGQSRFNTLPSLGAILYRDWGHIDSFWESAAIDVFPILTLEARHQIDVTEHRLALNDGQADIAIDGLDEIAVRILMECVQNHQIGIHPNLDLAHEFLPIANLSSVAGDHLSQFIIAEMSTEYVAVPQIRCFQFM